MDAPENHSDSEDAHYENSYSAFRSMSRTCAVYFGRLTALSNPPDFNPTFFTGYIFAFVRCNSFHFGAMSRFPISWITGDHTVRIQEVHIAFPRSLLVSGFHHLTNA